MTFILGCRVGLSGEQVFRGSESMCTLEVWDQDGHCQQSQTKGKELGCLVERKEEEQQLQGSGSCPEQHSPVLGVGWTGKASAPSHR